VPEESGSWLRTIRAIRDWGRTLIDEGRLSLGCATDGPFTQPPLHEVSEPGDRRTLARPEGPPRLPLNCAYLHLTGLGSRPTSVS
jgi:hypothetical protein